MGACLAALAAPAGALAQGAGDEQYTDPFSGEEATPTPTPAPAQAPAVSQATPTPAPAQPAQASQAPTASRPQLPLTGGDAGLLALAGSLLLAGGVALRVRLREPG